MNLPNKLTLFRFVLTFIFIYLISQKGFDAAVFATLTFTFACITDFLDGYIAKKYNLTSDFGKLMDPIADKFLILAAFLAFVRMQIVENWMVLFILSREFIVTGVRFIALNNGKVLAAEKAGKHKTVSQMVAIFMILGFIIFKESLYSHEKWSPAVQSSWKTGIDILMLITVALTLTSGFSFFWNNRKIIHADTSS